MDCLNLDGRDELDDQDKGRDAAAGRRGMLDEKERIERLINSAYSKGLKDGHREGYADGRASYLADIGCVKLDLKSLIKSVTELEQKMRQDNDPRELHKEKK